MPDERRLAPPKAKSPVLATWTGLFFEKRYSTAPLCGSIRCM